MLTLVKNLHLALDDLPAIAHEEASTIRVKLPPAEINRFGSPHFHLHRSLERVLYTRNIPNRTAIRHFSAITKLPIYIVGSNTLEIYTPKGILVHEHFDYN